MTELLGVILDAGHFHIADQIRWIWGTPECEAYLTKILLQDRDRQGFDHEVFKALSELQELHMKLNRAPKRRDVWQECCHI